MPTLVDQIDAFTNEPFKGNAAAICILEEDERKDDAIWQQAMAAEMNLSETAFVWNEGIRRVIRYFTPTVEVDFCGHATLAAAHCLWSRGIVSAEQPIEWTTFAGAQVACSRSADGCIEMDTPRIMLEGALDSDDLPPAVAAIETRVSALRAGQDWLVELEHSEQIRDFQPDLAAIAQLPRGLYVTARSEEEDVDFVSRCFFPGQGIPEDPVTGSAHCALGPYWAEKLEKNRLVAQQWSKRGGEVYVHVCPEIVRVSGYACTIIRGEFFA